jgi:hypothetical protein
MTRTKTSPEQATMRMCSAPGESGRHFSAILFGVSVHSALKLPFIFAFFLVNKPVSNSF